MLYKFTDEQWNANKAAQPGEFTNLPAGGYVCKIVDSEFTTSKAGNDMLNLKLDIAEGDFANYYQYFFDRFKNWNNNAIYRQLILDQKKNVSGFFKGLLEIIEDSNPNFTAYANNSVDTNALVDKRIGFVFAEEEYQKQNGDIATRAVARFPKTVSDIRDGDFTVPAIKKLDASKVGKNSGQLDIDIPSRSAPPPDFDSPF